MTFVMNSMNKAHASTVKPKTFFERGDVLNNPYANGGIPEGYGFIENIKGSYDLWFKIGEYVLKFLDFINDLPNNILIGSVTLLKYCYKILATLILQTPTFIFSNSVFKDSLSTFTILSIGVFTLFTVISRIKGTLGGKGITPLNKIIKRYFLAVIGMGFAPFLFEKSFYILNIVSRSITALGYHEISESDFIVRGDSEDGMDDADPMSKFDTDVDWLNVFALLGFDIVLIATLIPILLKNGRRWFDLIMLGTLTPFALSAWVLDEHRHYFKEWWQSVKRIALTQIVYAVFLAVMGIFIFLSKDVNDFWGLITKLAIISGGLWRMSNPPAFVLRMTDDNILKRDGILKNIRDIFSFNILKTPIKNLTSPFSLVGKLIKK